MSIKKRQRLTDIGVYHTVSVYSGDVFFGGKAEVPVTFGYTDVVNGTGHSRVGAGRRRIARINAQRKKKHKRLVSYGLRGLTNSTDRGGPCIIQHHGYIPHPIQVEGWNRPKGSGGIRQGTDGYMLLAPSNGFPSVGSLPSTLSSSTLIAYGTKAWAKYKPTAQRGGLGQALGELHDLPTLPKLLAYRNALKQAGRNTKWSELSKATGHNYLNYAFGWVPLLSDIRDLLKNALNLQKNLQQLIRDNGRPVRRSGKAGQSSDGTTVVTTTGTGNPGLLPSLPSACYSGTWTKRVETRQITDYYFSARFRYYIDFQTTGIFADNDRAHRVSKILLGAELSPYTLYQLLPWSWLVDWFTNLGSVINNLVNDAGDNLVADYAYINGKSTTYIVTTVTFTLANSPGGDGRGGPYTATFEELQTNFKRIAAIPFGFGLTFSGLSPKQLAILGALGLTKLS